VNEKAKDLIAMNMFDLVLMNILDATTTKELSGISSLVV
jgi:hypothetical protein